MFIIVITIIITKKEKGTVPFDRGGGRVQKTLIQGGSAPKSDPLPFYLLSLAEKIHVHTENWMAARRDYRFFLGFTYFSFFLGIYFFRIPSVDNWYPFREDPFKYLKERFPYPFDS